MPDASGAGWLRCPVIAFNMFARHRNFSILVTLSFAAAVCGCRTGPICMLRPVPYVFSRPDVAGYWIGFTSSNTDLSRLELKLDGTGLLKEAYTGMTNAETMQFEIRRWHIATNNVLTCLFSLRGADDSLKKAWPVKMTCKVTGTRLEALLTNGASGWTKSIVFWREKDLDEKLRALRQ
jgi:hypothetical protein